MSHDMLEAMSEWTCQSVLSSLDSSGLHCTCEYMPSLGAYNRWINRDSHGRGSPYFDNVASMDLMYLQGGVVDNTRCVNDLLALS